MSRLPDLVRDSQLETHFHSRYTAHVYHEADPAARQRSIPRKEYWTREKRIGRGGFGTVWLERCVKGQREAEVRAVKQFPKPVKAIEYIRELEAIAKFSHPRYVRCFVKSFGWYDHGNELYIAMEYLPHGDLQTYLTTAQPLIELEVQQITFQVLEGLSLMHENGFAHRDLKPQNILIHAKPPEEWWVKIADFGISKRAEDATAGYSTIKGTPEFMAPERDEVSSDQLSPAADMWALAEIIHRMFTLKPTFKNLRERFKFTERQQAFPKSDLQERKASQDAIQFMEVCMVPEPEARLSSKQALHHDWMARFLPASPRPPSIISLERSDIVEEDDIEATEGTWTISEPSASWTTLELTAPRQTTSTGAISQHTTELAESMSHTAAYPKSTTRYSTEGRTRQQIAKPVGNVTVTRPTSGQGNTSLEHGLRAMNIDVESHSKVSSKDVISAQAACEEDARGSPADERSSEHGRRENARQTSFSPDSISYTPKIGPEDIRWSPREKDREYATLRAISPDGAFVVTAARGKHSKFLYVWNTEWNSLHRKVSTGIQEFEPYVVFSPQQNILGVRAGMQLALTRIYDLSTNNPKTLNEFYDMYEGVNSDPFLEFSADGRFVATTTGREIHIRDLDRDMKVKCIRTGDKITSVKLDDKKIAIATAEGNVRIWSLGPTGLDAAVQLDPFWLACHITVSLWAPDMQTLIFSSDSYTFWKILDVPKRKHWASFPLSDTRGDAARQGRTLDSTFSYDSTLVAVRISNKCVQVRQVQTRSVRDQFTVDSTIQGIAFLMNGSLFAVLLDEKTGAMQYQVLAHYGGPEKRPGQQLVK